jgi:hypothetical protein
MNAFNAQGASMSIIIDAPTQNTRNRFNTPHREKQPQFNVRQEADRRLKFVLWLAEYREIEGQSVWIGVGGRAVQTTDWLFVAATALLACTARHDVAPALAAFAQKAGISYDVKTEARVCARACRAIDRRQGGRWLSAKKAGGYLAVTQEERRGYYEATGGFSNVDPVGESGIAKRGRKTAERRERHRDQVRAKRRADGVVPRGVYRQRRKRKTLPPWEALGLKKWTYYRRLRAGTLLVAVTPRNNPSSVQLGVSPRLRDLSNDFSAEPATRSVPLWLREGRLSEGSSESLGLDTHLGEKNSIGLKENDGGSVCWWRLGQAHRGNATGNRTGAFEYDAHQGYCRRDCENDGGRDAELAGEECSPDTTPDGRSHPPRLPLKAKRLTKKNLPPNFNGPPPDGFTSWAAWNVANAPKPKLASV